MSVLESVREEGEERDFFPSRGETADREGPVCGEIYPVDCRKGDGARLIRMLSTLRVIGVPGMSESWCRYDIREGACLRSSWYITVDALGLRHLAVVISSIEVMPQTTDL